MASNCNTETIIAGIQNLQLSIDNNISNVSMNIEKILNSNFGNIQSNIETNITSIQDSLNQFTVVFLAEFNNNINLVKTNLIFNFYGIVICGILIIAVFVLTIYNTYKIHKL